MGQVLPILGRGFAIEDMKENLTARKEAETFEEAIRLVFQAVEAEIKKFREKLTNVDAPQDPELVEME